MPDPVPASLHAAFDRLTFVGGRTPDSTDAELGPAFAVLADYRDGGIFIGHYAGASQWERHAQGDEVVYVVEGETTLFMLSADGERALTMRAGEVLVVPANTWHRFETPVGVKILTVTPQPTDHSREKPPPEGGIARESNA